jgi:starch phosphorylase
VATETVTLERAESYEAGRHRYDGSVRLGRSGAFGYTVRAVPRNDLLASPAELGVVALPV